MEHLNWGLYFSFPSSPVHSSHQRKKDLLEVSSWTTTLLCSTQRPPHQCLLPIVPGIESKLLNSAFKALKDLTPDDISNHPPLTTPGPSFQPHQSTRCSPNLGALSCLCFCSCCAFCQVLSSPHSNLSLWVILFMPTCRFYRPNLFNPVSPVNPDTYIQMNVLHCLMTFSETSQCPKQNCPSLPAESPYHSTTWYPSQ